MHHSTKRIATETLVFNMVPKKQLTTIDLGQLAI